MAPSRQSRNVTTRFDGGTRRRRHGVAARRRVRNARGNAARVRVVRRDAAGHRRRPMGIVVAPGVWTDQRDVTDGVRNGRCAGRAVHAQLCDARADAEPDGRADEARSRSRATRIARQLHLDGCRHWLHGRRGTVDYRRTVAQLLRHLGAAGADVLPRRARFPGAYRRDRPCRTRGWRIHAARSPRRQTLVPPRPIHADGHRPRRALCVDTERAEHRACSDDWRIAIGSASAIRTGPVAADLADARADRTRADGDRSLRSDLERARGRAQIGPAHRRQPGVHRTGAREYRRRLHVQLSDVGFIQPHGGQLRSGRANTAGLRVLRAAVARDPAARAAARRLPAGRFDGSRAVHHCVGPDRHHRDAPRLAHEPRRCADARRHVHRNVDDPTRGRDSRRRTRVALDLSQLGDTSSGAARRPRSVCATPLPRNAARFAALPAARYPAYRRRRFFRLGRAYSRRDRGGPRVATGDAASAADRNRHQPHRQRRRRAARLSRQVAARVGDDAVLVPVATVGARAARPCRHPGCDWSRSRVRIEGSGHRSDLSATGRCEMRSVSGAHFFRMPGDASRRQRPRQTTARAHARPTRLSIRSMEVAIIGAGIGGLTLALALQSAGIASRVFEATTDLRPLGVGINVLPHASRELRLLGLESALTNVSVLTREAAFFNRFGQLIHREPLGRDAGYADPQYSIHRAALHRVLHDAVVERLGVDRINFGSTCTGFEQDDAGVVAKLQDTRTGERQPEYRADALIACDGLHSAIRKQLHPDEGRPLYSGVNMWRGVSTWKPILTGATMIRAGWLATGKMVVYPIRNEPDGRQIVNWVAEVETPRHRRRDWNRAGSLDDFISHFEQWHFDWLDVPALIRAANAILEFPMVDQDPLPFWTQGR